MDILVHVAASSTAKDDARYRAQVAALQSFQPVSKHPIHVLDGHGHRHETLPEDPETEGPRPQTQGQNQETPLSVIPDSQSQLEIQPLPQPILSPRPAKRPRLSPTSTTTTPATINLTTFPLQAHPTPPTPSSSPFATHLTPSLSLLASRLSLPRIYKPAHQSRPLDLLERGHWVLRITLHPDDDDPAPGSRTWSMRTLSRVWGFLRSFIVEGRAGWGVWGLLENPSIHHDELCLKVYTWGEVIPHIYLLLFLATERRVRKMAAQWRDAADEVVVQMP